MFGRRCRLVLLLMASVVVALPWSLASEGETPEPAPEITIRSETGAPVKDARILTLTPRDAILPVGHGLFSGGLETDFPSPPETRPPVPVLDVVRAPGFAPGVVGVHSFAGHTRRSAHLEPGLTARVMLVDQAGRALPAEGAFAFPTPFHNGVNAGVAHMFNLQRLRWNRRAGIPTPEGGFILRDLPSGVVTLGVRLSPSAVLLRGVPIWRSDQTFYFRRPAFGHLSGKVTSAAGEPVPGCHVLARLGGAPGSRWTRAVATGQTDETGSFRFEAPAGSLLRTEFYAPGHGPARLVPKLPRKPRELQAGKELTVNARLPIECILEGRLVHAANGKPVAGMYVLARCEPRATRASAMPLALSGPDGTFRIRGLAPGRVTLSGMSATHCLPPRTISLSATLDTPPTIEVPPPGGLHGVLLNSRGRPAPAISVIVRHSGRIVDTVRTGPDGKFTMRRLPSGAAELIFVTPDFRGFRQRVLADIPVAGGEVIRREGTAIPIDIVAGRELGPIRIQAPDLVVLSGRAVGDDDKGVPGARFLIEEGFNAIHLPAARSRINTLGITGPDGRFNLALPRVCLESDQVCLFSPGLTVAQFKDGGEDLEVRLATGHRLIGTVIDRRKKPMWGRRLTLSMKLTRETSGTWKQPAWYEVETDLKGRFEISGLPAGEYRLDGRPKFGRVDFRIDADLERNFILKPR